MTHRGSGTTVVFVYTDECCHDVWRK